MTIRRWLVGTLTALAVLSALSACSPPILPMIAVTLDQGEPVLLLARCERPKISHITITWYGPRHSDSASPRAVYASWGIEIPLADGRIRAATPARIPFFTVPDGWEPDPRTAKLTRLEDGVEYSAEAPLDSMDVLFTTADLRALRTGDVITADHDHWPEHRIMSEPDFWADTQDNCR